MEFNKEWEIEYIKKRVEKVAEAVEDGQYDRAIDFLKMIQDKAKNAETYIRSELKNK